MVKPNIKEVKKEQSKVLLGNGLIEKVKADEKFREKVLQNTANNLMSKYGKALDVEYKGVSETGKSFRIAFNGIESKSKYVVIPYGNSARFMSSKGIPRKN